MANATINILECNNTRIRVIVTEGDNPLSRVTIFTNNVERGFWTTPPLNNEKSYDWQPSHFNEGLNEIKVNARDNQGNVVSEFRYIIKGLDENSSLQNIIDENVRIKDDISTNCANFKSKLIDAGANVENTNKLSDMIPEVESLTTRKYGVGYYREIFRATLPDLSPPLGGSPESGDQRWETMGTYTVNTREKYVDVVRLEIYVRNHYQNVGEKYRHYIRFLVNGREVFKKYSDGNDSGVRDTKMITLMRGDVVEAQSSSYVSQRKGNCSISFGYIDSSFAD